MKRKILVLTDHMPWGHRSIAKAIYSFLKSKEKENSWKVDYAEVKAATGVAGEIYKLSYRYLPASNVLAHKLMSLDGTRKLTEDFSIVNLPELKKVVNYYKPDLIISAYFFHSHSLAQWRKMNPKINFKLWTIVADPWTINPVSFVKDADLHLVYDQVGVSLGVKAGIEKGKMLVTGWWVRPQMYEKYQKMEVRKKLGLKDDRPVVFVGGGSLGNSAITRLLPVLMMVKKPVGVIFNTGTDKMAYNLVEEYVRIYKLIKKDNHVWIKNLGWIDNMAEILAACDVVFGKAGPNFLFDVVAQEKPFVAITHIGGQEDGNIELIRKKHLGWVKEKGSEMADMLLKYLDNPKIGEKLTKHIKEEANQNKRGLINVEREIKKILND